METVDPQKCQLCSAEIHRASHRADTNSQFEYICTVLSITKVELDKPAKQYLCRSCYRTNLPSLHKQLLELIRNCDESSGYLCNTPSPPEAKKTPSPPASKKRASTTGDARTPNKRGGTESEQTSNGLEVLAALSATLSCELSTPSPPASTKRASTTGDARNPQKRVRTESEQASNGLDELPTLSCDLNTEFKSVAEETSTYSSLRLLVIRL